MQTSDPIGFVDKEAAMPAPLAIEAHGLSLTFETSDGKVEALSNVDLQIEAGDFVSFIGPSGCGKTTLLRIIADLERPTEGTILVNGVTPEQARLKRHYGYIFQAPALYPWRTIERNVMVPLEVMGVAWEERRARAAHYLRLVNLSGFERKFPWQLSGGMQQRVSIARALSFDPALLLMDEPFGALDEIVRDHLNEQLLRLWEETGKTVVFVTHSIPEAVFLSTRIVVMSPRRRPVQRGVEDPGARSGRCVVELPARLEGPGGRLGHAQMWQLQQGDEEVRGVVVAEDDAHR